MLHPPLSTVREEFCVTLIFMYSTCLCYQVLLYISSYLRIYTDRHITLGCVFWWSLLYSACLISLHLVLICVFVGGGWGKSPRCTLNCILLHWGLCLHFTFTFQPHYGHMFSFLVFCSFSFGVYLPSFLLLNRERWTACTYLQPQVWVLREVMLPIPAY